MAIGKETILSLLGMLLGTLLVPRLNTPWSTYTALFLLVWLHLTINYFGVGGLALRTLNRQRPSIVGMTYRNSTAASPLKSSKSLSGTTPQVTQIPSPATVSSLERIFDLSGFGTIRDTITGKNLGLCFIGSTLSEHLVQHQQPAWVAARLLQFFETERHLIWFDAGCLSRGLHRDMDIIVIKEKTGIASIMIKRGGVDDWNTNCGHFRARK